MIDRVKAKMTWTDSSFADRLTECVQVKDVHTGDLITKGILGSLRVYHRRGQLVIDGSLPYFYCRNSAAVLTASEIQESIELIEFRLGVPIGEALVTLLEVGTTVRLDHPCGDYTQELGELPRFERFEYIDGVTFKQRRTELSVYNKGRKQKKRRETVEPADKDRVVKVELRMKGAQALQRLKLRQPLTLAALCSLETLQVATGEFLRLVDMIGHKQIKLPPLPDLLTPPLMREYAASCGVQLQEVYEGLHRSIRQHPIRSRRSELRGELRRLSAGGGAGTYSTLCKDLQVAVRASLESALQPHIGV
jgi:hypothetical protein